jgi:hypothetical protein
VRQIPELITSGGGSIATTSCHESKKELKEYIDKTIAACGIKTTYVFGFAHEGPGPQRHGGFDVGVWQSRKEREFYAAIQERFLIGKRLKNSELYDNEGVVLLIIWPTFANYVAHSTPWTSFPRSRKLRERSRSSDLNCCGHTSRERVRSAPWL